WSTSVVAPTAPATYNVYVYNVSDATMASPLDSKSFTVASTGPTCPTSYPDVSVTGVTSGGTVWGSGPYTDDSNLAMAGVHAGLISVGQSATIHRTSTGSTNNYVASTRNGVTTSNWNTPWCGVNLSASVAPPPNSALISHITARVGASGSYSNSV